HQAIADLVGLVPTAVGAGAVTRREERLDERADRVARVGRARLRELAEPHHHRPKGRAPPVELVGLQRVARPVDERLLELEHGTYRRGSVTAGQRVVEGAFELTDRLDQRA